MPKIFYLTNQNLAFYTICIDAASNIHKTRTTNTKVSAINKPNFLHRHVKRPRGQLQPKLPQFTYDPTKITCASEWYRSAVADASRSCRSKYQSLFHEVRSVNERRRASMNRRDSTNVPRRSGQTLQKLRPTKFTALAACAPSRSKTRNAKRCYLLNQRRLKSTLGPPWSLSPPNIDIKYSKMFKTSSKCLECSTGKKKLVFYSPAERWRETRLTRKRFAQLP